MHYTGVTFRPPYEGRSLLLQVTTGCSHGACRFCSMYRNAPFSVSPIEEVIADLEETAFYAPYMQRVFLENGDAFCLSADKLLEIAELIHKYLPNVKSIGGYANIKNIMSKTDDELRALTEAGFANFNIGIESALDDVLAQLNKGYNSTQAREQLGRLRSAGMPFNMNIINAAAGPGRIEEHAQANAAFVNEVEPTLVFVTPLHVDPGTPLADDLADGTFEECTLGEYIDEEIALLEGLELSDCVFYGMHISNPIQVLGGLPKDKSRMLRELKQGKDTIAEAALDSHPVKTLEGRPIIKRKHEEKKHDWSI